MRVSKSRCASPQKADSAFLHFHIVILFLRRRYRAVSISGGITNNARSIPTKSSLRRFSGIWSTKWRSISSRIVRSVNSAVTTKTRPMRLGRMSWICGITSSATRLEHRKSKRGFAQAHRTGKSWSRTPAAARPRRHSLHEAAGHREGQDLGHRRAR